jgi:hypothetical protein
MFIELHSPEIIDRVADVSSVGVRIGEGWSREYGPRGPWGKYWLSLKFKNQDEAVKFFEDAIARIKGPYRSE